MGSAPSRSGASIVGKEERAEHLSPAEQDSALCPATNPSMSRMRLRTLRALSLTWRFEPDQTLPALGGETSAPTSSLDRLARASLTWLGYGLKVIHYSFGFVGKLDARLGFLGSHGSSGRRGCHWQVCSLCGQDMVGRRVLRNGCRPSRPSGDSPTLLFLAARDRDSGAGGYSFSLGSHDVRFAQLPLGG